ncbi:MAG: hypothetical protein QM728_04230 [Gordonia sp. (in: high G+C Gram-positive bacteria)]|uniref:hypothetical protein n=1 Tax=Gordonia sp. (in: high G+C Gram-positive bacteria) TaxID=84139 RepID=UPI0039E6E210
MADSDVAALIAAVTEQTLASIDAMCDGESGAVCHRDPRRPATEAEVTGAHSRRLLRPAGWTA